MKKTPARALCLLFAAIFLFHAALLPSSAARRADETPRRVEEPLNAAGKSGGFGFAIRAAAILLQGHLQNLCDFARIEARFKERLTVAEARELCDGILSGYGDDVRLIPDERAGVFRITSSFLVTDRDDRRAICVILARTPMMSRSPQSLSAEWSFHNLCYALGVRRANARDVDLDFVADPRAAVRIACALTVAAGWY